MKDMLNQKTASKTPLKEQKPAKQVVPPPKGKPGRPAKSIEDLRQIGKTKYGK